MEENLNLETVEEVKDICTEGMELSRNSNKGIAITLGVGVAALLGTIVYKKVKKSRLEKKAKLEEDIDDSIEDETEID